MVTPGRPLNISKPGPRERPLDALVDRSTPRAEVR